MGKVPAMANGSDRMRLSRVGRDPFARAETVRVRVYLPEQVTCNWCGANRRTPSGRTYLYQYGTATDGGRVSICPRPFCSIDCHRSFNS